MEFKFLGYKTQKTTKIIYTFEDKNGTKIIYQEIFDENSALLDWKLKNEDGDDLIDADLIYHIQCEVDKMNILGN